MKQNTCFFTGHRKFKPEQVETFSRRIKHEVEILMEKGVTTFISGGAIGFDAIAASYIITLKQQGANIKLIIALPCRNHSKYWKGKEKVFFQTLLGDVDDVHYVSEDYSEDCFDKRDMYMIDNSSYCICALVVKASGTGQTVKNAYSKKINVINVGHPLYKPSTA
jgi:uncharacterized phage-like protein YoqJ